MAVIRIWLVMRTVVLTGTQIVRQIRRLVVRILRIAITASCSTEKPLESVELVYGPRMESDVAGRINWKMKDGLEFDRLWTIYWLHPVFK
ncbi:MAG: hypothetical protein F4X40_08540 [Chloroflexi bacterium]|nr:hypothetical protein [Chloroflexota bacterium]